MCRTGDYGSMESHTFSPALIPALIMEMKKYFYIEIQMARDLITAYGNIVMLNIFTEDLYLFTPKQ